MKAIVDWIRCNCNVFNKDGVYGRDNRFLPTLLVSLLRPETPRILTLGVDRFQGGRSVCRVKLDARK